MPTKKNILRLGLIQMSASWDLQDNIAKATRNIVKVAGQGAQVICLPELFRTPYFCQSRQKKFFDLAETIPGPSSRYFGEMAKKLGVTIIISLFERADFVGTGRDLSLQTKRKKAHFYNTAITMGPNGKIISKYRKIHIPDDPANYYDEAHYFEKGDLGFGAVKTRVGTGRDLSLRTIGTLVCWDQWFPEGARHTTLKGAQVLFYPTAIGFQVKNRTIKSGSGNFDMNKQELDAWQTIQRSHAIANNVFVVAVNRVGREDHLQFWGSSFVADPYGRVIAQASTTREQNLVVDCDLGLIETMRRDWPFLEAWKGNRKLYK